MTAILRRLPFLEREDEIAVGMERVRVRPYQIIVWVSLTAKQVVDFPPSTARFPAILDTGHNHNFSIQHQQLFRWTAINPTQVTKMGRIRESERQAELHALSIWLHLNQPGQRDLFADCPPLRLELPSGVAVYPEGTAFPPLPLLGLRALVRNKLHVAIDSDRCVVNVRTSDRRTRLWRWLS